MWHDSERRLEKAVARFEEGNLDAARSMLRGLDRRGVISPSIDLYLGHCHLEQDDIRAAIRRYRRCASLMPESSPHRAAPWMGLGLCYGRLGKIERATQAFRRAQAIDPQIEEAHSNLVHCYALQGDVGRAERHAERAVELDPTRPGVFRHLAVAYMVVGRLRQALGAWEQVRLRNPDHPELDLGRARVWSQMGRPGRARRAFQRATSGPFAAEAWHGLGELEFEAGRPVVAAEHFTRCLTLETDHEEARLRLAECRFEGGELAAVEELLEPLLAQWPPSAEVAGLATRLRLARGERRSAFALLRRLLRTDGGQGSAAIVAAGILLELQRPRLAVRLLGRQRRRGGLSVPAVRLLARGLARTGRARRATSLLAATVVARPEERELHLDLAAVQVARGRVVAAERGLLRALGQNPESATLWAAAAEMAFDQGRQSLARARLRSALRRNRRHPTALALLVQWLIAEGAWLRAANAARAAGRQLPDSDPVHRDHGQALLRCGRWSEAAVPLRRYVLGAPEDPAGFGYLADALEGTGDLPGAATQRRISRAVERLSVS